MKDLIATRLTGSQEYITKEGLNHSSASIVPAGVVIMATRMALVKAVVANCNVAINQDLKAIAPSAKIVSSYLLYWLLYHAKQIEALGTGSTVKGIQIETVKSLKMRIPNSVAEQKKIVSVLFAADQKTETLQTKLTHLKQEKKALMQQLLTGKRRVKVDTKEAE